MVLSAFLLGNIIPPIVAFEIITVVYSPDFEFAETAISVTVRKKNTSAEMEMS